MKCVIIESPYAGDTKLHEEYARKCMLDSINRGEAPFLSHLLYTQVLNDRLSSDRLKGLSCGWAWMQKADFVAVYTDLGISKGMKGGIKRALQLGLPVEYRTLS